MPPTPPQSPPSRTLIQKLTIPHLPSPPTSVEPQPATLYRTHLITIPSPSPSQKTTSASYTLRTTPHPQTRLLRHEQDRLEAEAGLLHFLSTRALTFPVPQLLHYATAPNPLHAAYVLSGPYPSPPALSLLCPHERENSDRALGRHLRHLNGVKAPAFGPFRLVQAGKGFATWSRGFGAMLEGVLRDGEDALVSLPYEGVRRGVGKCGGSLDLVGVAGLVVVEVEGVGGIGAGMEVGLKDYSTAVFGDAWAADVMGLGAGREGVVEGFGGRGTGARDEVARRLCYRLYHAVLAIVRQSYRPQADDRELCARRTLTSVLRQLDDMTAIGGTG